MTDAEVVPVEPPRRFQFGWVLPALFRPRKTLAKITAQNKGVWFTPILVLILAALLSVIVAGSIKHSAAQMGQVTLPPDFQYWSPSQQTQYQQTMSATSGPVFIYVFPAVVALLKVVVGWLLVGGLLHLALTLLGGRGDTGSAMNLVAWAGLPFAVRDLVRAAAMQVTKRLITSPGLAGFAPAGQGGWYIFLGALLGLVDIYVIWHAVLLIIGVRAGNGLRLAKAIFGVLVILLLVLSLQALVSFLTAKLSGLTTIRPFF